MIFFTKNRYIITLTFFVLLLNTGCEEKAVPKPYGYFRIDLPLQKYERVSYNNFSFQKSEYANLKQHKKREWFNLEYPYFNANIFFSYQKIENNFSFLVNESQKVAYKHQKRADAIYEKTYNNKQKQVYATVYELQGDVASTFQFVLTDSVKNFLRGAVYFETTPNQDSISPVADFLQKDMVYLIETFEWK